MIRRRNIAAPIGGRLRDRKGGTPLAGARLGREMLENAASMATAARLHPDAPATRALGNVMSRFRPEPSRRQMIARALGSCNFGLVRQTFAVPSSTAPPSSPRGERPLAKRPVRSRTSRAPTTSPDPRCRADSAARPPGRVGSRRHGQQTMPPPRRHLWPLLCHPRPVRRRGRRQPGR